MGYDAVLFDHDGVLVEVTTQATHLDGARRAFEAVGVDDPDEDDVETLSIGVTPDQLHEVCERYSVDPTVFWYHRDQITADGQYEEMRAGQKTPYSDLGALADLPVPLGVVSSNQRTTVAFSLAYFDMERHFETMEARDPTVDSLHRKKPNPHYVECALDDLGGGSALYVGDRENDALAAHRAGLDSVFLRRPHCRSVDLSVDPTYELETLYGLAELLDF